MDDLDRMYRRLVHNIRAGFPDLLTQPMEVASVHQHLIPYRLNRRELGLESADDYELTLTRLLSGARGLLNGDADMQTALRAELESANPDLSAFRAFGTARVQLAPDALRALETQSAEPVPGATPLRADLARRETQELAAAGPPAPPSQPHGSMRPSPVVLPLQSQAHHTGCRYCGGELPDGREIHFCPHCGQNLSVKQCPACSTELEVEWQYCINCGRQVE